MTAFPTGRASVRIGGRVIEAWDQYQVALDMLEPADAFSVTLPGGGADLLELCPLDAEIEVFIDGTRVLSGFIGSRVPKTGRGGSQLTLSGRDRTGRLTDESMPLGSLKNLTLQELGRKVAGDWFDRVELSNAENRRLLRGAKTRPVAAWKEPPIDTTRQPKRRVEPGETRWQVLAYFLELADYLAWSSADGKSLIIGRPNYDQAAAYRFFLPGPGSSRAMDGNVLEAEIHEDIEECFSEITVVASSGGAHRAVAVDGPGARGIGRTFQRRKALILQDDLVHSQAEAKKRAERELAVRQAHSHEIHLLVRGHVHPADETHLPTLYAPDNMADVELEEWGIRGPYLVTAATYTKNREAGALTRLILVPKGAALRL